MGEIHKDLLKQQLQAEIDKARSLEASGKSKEAGEHYMKAAAIYRKLGYESPQGQQAENMFNTANQYERLGKTIKETSTYTRSEIDEIPGIIDSLIVSQKPDTKWEDIGNLEDAKTDLKEAIILPLIKTKPDYVRTTKTILLYGPPGTGKTLLAKASSNTLEGNFFEAKASSLLSKYYGESAKLINALFNKAKDMQPAIIFMDEIDSVVISRDSGINEATRRVVGQLLTEIEGFNTKKEEEVIFMGATNKPWSLDDAMLSRFQKKIYVPLPNEASRRKIFGIHLRNVELDMSLTQLSQKSEGFSGRDIANVCREAVTLMIREQNPGLQDLSLKEIERYELKHRPLKPSDFDKSFEKIKPTSTASDLEKYKRWADEFGG